jgi:hypothetical protein
MNDLIATSDQIKEGQAGYRDAGTGFGFYEDYTGIRDAIKEGSWIDGSIAGLGAALNVGSTLIDPFSTLLSMGIEWAMEQVEPLKEALDWLAGDPETIETVAMTWDNIANELFAIGEEFEAAVDSEIPTWQDDAAEAYRDMAGFNVDLVGAFGATALGMGEAVRGAGNLVSMVREFVRGFVADCIAKVVVWLAEVVFTAGAAAPIVAAQLAAAVVKWVGRIFGWLMGLITSIQSLRALLDI